MIFGVAFAPYGRRDARSRLERACLEARGVTKWGERGVLSFSFPHLLDLDLNPPPKKKISTQTEELLIKRRALLEKKIEAEQGKAREQAALKNKRGKSYL